MVSCYCSSLKMPAEFTFGTENLNFTAMRKFGNDSEISNKNMPSIIVTLHNAIISLSIFTQLHIPQLEQLSSCFRIILSLGH